MKMRTLVGFLAAMLAASAALLAANPLSIISAGPKGEISSLAEANEVRVVFSEPMVVLGRIPQPVRAPFFHISPAVSGTFRWAGTTTLIFTPDPKKPLPYATRYEVTIDAGTTAVEGARLERSYVFSFTTPTVRLLQTKWYRKSGRFDDPVHIVLRFNQPVSAKALGEHISLRYAKHAWKAPVLSAAGADWLRKNDPSAITNFEAKVARTRRVVSSEGKIVGFFASEWNRKEYPPSSDMVVFETQPGVPPDAWIRVALDAAVPGLQGTATRGKPQEIIVKLEPTFFINGFRCEKACDPDSWNPLILRAKVKVDAARKTTRVVDITDPAHENTVAPASPKSETNESDYQSGDTWSLGFEDLGYSHQPAHAYRVTVDGSLRATDGQTLGYTWAGVVEDWHQTAFTSFGEGHGVWEKGDPLLPFYARNITWVEQSLAPVAAPDLMPLILRLEKAGFRLLPDGTPKRRKLPVKPDTIQSHGIDIGPLLAPNGSALLWAGIRDGDPIPRASKVPGEGIRSSLVQVTNLGISVKDSPLNTLVFVTRLDDGRPVEGAKVSLIDVENRTVWQGVTDAHGLALAPDTPLRIPKPHQPKEGATEEDEGWWDLWKTKFIVTAEKDGDLAYAGSNWNEGILPWDFNQDINLRESLPLIRGTIFTDRGVYKPGEEVHFKAILRSDTPTGIRPYAKGTTVDLELKDSRDRQVDRRSVQLSEWSSAEWTLTVPAEGALGTYTLNAGIAGQYGNVFGHFLVAAYRRPDFRVDATLKGDTPVAGTGLTGGISARYLFGGAMSGRKVKWTYSKAVSLDVPSAVYDRFSQEKWTFLGWDPDNPVSTAPQTIRSRNAVLDAGSSLSVPLETDIRAGVPLRYSFEGEVEDVSRQKIAGRASILIHPAPWYLGVKSLPYFADTSTGIDTAIVAASLAGEAVPDVAVHVRLTRVQWHSVRRAEGNGFYTWDVERTESEAGAWDVTTRTEPVPLHIDIRDGGYYVLRATAGDAAGRSTTTISTFYALGPGYTAWARYDHNRIDLVPEKKSWRPGDDARIMIQSPWEKATALVTTEREGIRTSREFQLQSTQQTITVPITESDIPNIYVSVLLVKGRTKEPDTQDSSDPGKPSFRLGYTELNVEDASRKLDVGVKANREEYRPATKARIEVSVRDRAGKPAPAEVTLWAVDYGVLSLTAYQTPDIIESVYVRKTIQVLNEDSRQKIISRRVLTPKGADEGGGGGVDAGPGALRKDFRVLAFWLGSVATDRKGIARTEVVLPESLTTYRIMAVAADKANRFGWGQREIRTSKPVLLRPAWPRFLAVGDKAHFGAVVQNQLGTGGTATVTIRSLDPGVLELTGETSRTIEVAPGGAAEVRFDALAKSAGSARIQTSVKLLGESDAFEDTVPVRILVSPETTAAYGQASPIARENVQIPAGVVSSLGGLHLELSSTAMVGLGQGARFLVEYPYGCAEQRASRGLALLLTQDLGQAFRLPGIEPDKLRTAAQANLTELEKFQCDGGGFAFWPGECWSASPYLTSYVLHVLQRGKQLRYSVDQSVLDAAAGYLQKSLTEPRPVNEGWWPAYTAWQAFAVKVLADGGVAQDSNINRLWSYRDRMPVFGLSYLLDAMIARGEKGARPDDLRRDIANAVLAEGGTAHVEELSDPYLLYFWNSNVRSTAIVLRTLVADSPDSPIVPRMVRWLMQVRKNGRWDNTQENALAMEALVDYYRRYESETPDFAATVTLGGEQLVAAEFRGRSTEARTSDLPMQQLLTKAPAGEERVLELKREGTGTLFYMASLRYAVDALFQQGLDHGLLVERRYYPAEAKDAATSFKAGDLVRVVLDFELPKERRFVAVTDPLPAGFEPVESWFATTASDLARPQQEQEGRGTDWSTWWRRGGFDHVERHDDRVTLFATRLASGKHTFSYVVRATTAGTFRTAPAHAEEMYEPEVFGRTATAVIELKP